MAWKANHGAGRHEQRGQVAVIVGFSIVALILMLGLVLDLGHLYIAKTELQNAADACALSAVRVLGGSRELKEAIAAGQRAGQENKVDFQTDPIVINSQDVEFSDSLNGTYKSEIGPATQYARCQPHHSNPKSIVLLFMGIVGLSQWELEAAAVARMVPGRHCAIPLAMCTTEPQNTNPKFGFVKGTWYGGRLAPGSAVTGNYDWIEFKGQGARGISDLLAGVGQCNVDMDLVDAKGGNLGSGVAPAWNTRFGLYTHAGGYDDMTLYPPDKTGWAYTPGNWSYPEPQDAYHRDYAGGVNRRDKTNDPYNWPPDVSLPGNTWAITQPDHRTYGQYRREIIAPVIACKEWNPNKKNIPVLDWACALMVSPIGSPDEVKLEFLGFASEGSCASAGFPGGSGALVPALVQ